MYVDNADMPTEISIKNNAGGGGGGGGWKRNSENP